MGTCIFFFIESVEDTNQVIRVLFKMVLVYTRIEGSWEGGFEHIMKKFKS